MIKACQLNITVAISTMSDGLPMLHLPEVRHGIRYLLLVQERNFSQPRKMSKPFQDRCDVKLVLLSGAGLSRSRNAAFELTNDPLIVFSDDDIQLEPEGLLELGRAFTVDPKLDLAAGWRRELGPLGGPTRLTHFNSGRVCAPELMVRKEAIMERGVRFDTEFGLGARYGLGEEYVFITDALKAGCKGMSLPVVAGAHPHSSTGDNWSDVGLMQARQEMLKRVFGFWIGLVRPLYAWRHRRRFSSLSLALRFALGLSFDGR